VFGNPPGDTFEPIGMRLAHSALGDERGALRPILHRDRETRRRKPSVYLLYEGIGHFAGVERGIDRPNQFDERVSAIQPVL
jgi:hypothetical protein